MAATIQREAIESLLVTVVTDADPDSNAVEFCAVAAGDRPTGWVAASWQPPTVQRRDLRWEARIKTPTLGATGAGIELDAGHYDTYARINEGAEEIVLETGRLVVE